MKKLFSTFAQGMLFMALALVLTGCDEFFSMMDNPVTPRLNVRSNSITLKVGATASCEASTQDHVALFYASADPAVATVDAKGTITGVAVGKTKITVTAKGEDEYYRTQIFGENTQVIDVEVIPAKVDVESIKLDQTTLDKKVGDAAVTLTATVNPSDADDKTVTWKSSDETVATVADGVVTFVAAGTATITATATNGTDDTADDKTATCVVTITAAAPSMRSTPLTFEALTAGTIVVSNPQGGLQYSKNGGDKTAVTHNAAIDVAIGDKVSFYGNCTKTWVGGISGGTQFKNGTADVKVYGNIMSLLDATGFATTNTLTADNTFRYLFQDYSHLIHAGDLQLPATTITKRCYLGMFDECVNLTAAPKKLPAMELKLECYNSMFYHCAKITSAPELPATTLVTWCYNQMFKKCTGLTTAYVKAAYAVGDKECYEMFENCTAAGAVLHTTTASKASWDALMPSTWATWTAVGDWND